MKSRTEQYVPTAGLLFVKNNCNGGGGGIRTHETLSGLLVFKTSAFNHSATPPQGLTHRGVRPLARSDLFYTHCQLLASSYNKDNLIEASVDPQTVQPNNQAPVAPPAPVPTPPSVTPVPQPEPAPQPQPQAASVPTEPAKSVGPQVDPNLPQSYTWEASEYIYHEKPAFYYLGLWVITAVIAAALAYFQQWLSIAVVVVMALAVMVYSRKQPRTLQYQLDATGVTIHGDIQPFTSFHSYGVMQDTAWYSVDLEPNKRFVPRLTLICENDDIDTIDKILSQHLPRVDRDPDWIERTTRYLRF